MNEALELAPQQLAKPRVDVLDMIQALIDKGIKAQDVAVLESLEKLHERIEAKNAEKEFNIAFAKLQKQIPNVKADKAVVDNCKVMFHYCSYEEIYSQAQPFLAEHGFGVSFSQRRNPDATVTTIMALIHASGHSRTNEYTVRVGASNKMANDTNRDAAASTIAQREAFCDGLNIIRRGRDDAHLEGGPITTEQAKSLRERVKATASDERAFLKFAGAETFEKIGSEKYAMLDANLRRKEHTK